MDPGIYRNAMEDVLKRHFPGDVVYASLGSMLVICIGRDHSDPMKEAFESIDQIFEPEERNEFKSKLRDFAAYFFQEINREDLLEKYKLWLQ